jgi:chromosome segregation ATPase
MSRFVPVSFEKWAEMVKAQSDLVRYKEMCDELDAECTRLKDENARLRSFCTRTIIPNIDLEKEITRLKAEVERLKEGNEYLDQMHEKEMARSAFLCEQVERLTKAVMHSPAAQLKLKELEGKNTYEEINPDNQ